ncbi:hypothetical protein GCM10023317_09370 [Actinopolymorpha pittospori]
MGHLRLHLESPSHATHRADLGECAGLTKPGVHAPNHVAVIRQLPVKIARRREVKTNPAGPTKTDEGTQDPIKPEPTGGRQLNRIQSWFPAQMNGEQVRVTDRLLVRKVLEYATLAAEAGRHLRTKPQSVDSLG